MKTKHMRRTSAKDSIVNQIIDLEWEMFQSVEAIGGRASCQNDADTFYIMRYSNYAVFDEDTLSSCREDFIRGKSQGRNLVMEKYGYMMEVTDPEYFNATLRERLPRIDALKTAKVKEICDAMENFDRRFAKEYPKFSGQGRTPSEVREKEASARVYLEGELKTYSVETLDKYMHAIRYMDGRGINPVSQIRKMSAGFYGYDSLEAAEESISS